MKIEHVALWVKNLEISKNFYEKYFQAKAGEKYTNSKTGFESYFLYFSEVLSTVTYRSDTPPLGYLDNQSK